ncbi:MAG: hypothetical protein HQK70_12065 [Desulfamplus sp.]|nr:hypothetical protein [Desulfamplus sp.]
MKKKNLKSFTSLFIYFLFALSVYTIMLPAQANAVVSPPSFSCPTPPGCDCSTPTAANDCIKKCEECEECKNTAFPPFIAQPNVVKPNMLLLIDNSASMYDIGYNEGFKRNNVIVNDSPCIDNNYDATKEYMGYFVKDQFYIYDSASELFTIPTSDVTVYDYTAVDSNGDVYLYIDAADSTNTSKVNKFKAKGNYLNWVTSSKFDLEKKILTGGKYNENSCTTTYSCADGSACTDTTDSCDDGSTCATTYSCPAGAGNCVDVDTTIPSCAAGAGNCVDTTVTTDSCAAISAGTCTNTTIYSCPSGDCGLRCANGSSCTTAAQCTKQCNVGTCKKSGAICTEANESTVCTASGDSCKYMTNVCTDLSCTNRCSDTNPCTATSAKKCSISGQDCTITTTTTPKCSISGQDCSPTPITTTSKKCSINNQDCIPVQTCGNGTPCPTTTSKKCSNGQNCTSGEHCNYVLESEGRGCSGHNFIKQVKVGSRYFTLGVRTDTDPTDAINTTLLDILPLSSTPSDPITKCSGVIPALQGNGLANVVQALTACFGADDTSERKLLHDTGQDCWKMAHDKNPAPGHANKLETLCEEIYTANPPTPPNKILPATPGYICSDKYIGKFWTGSGWNITDDNFMNTRKQFCGDIFTPNATDPSDMNIVTNQAIGNITAWWGTDAFLVNYGVYAQLGNPTATYKVRVKTSAAELAAATPTPILEKYQGSINIGAMAFKPYGSLKECSANPPLKCPSTGITNYDGAYLVQEIGQGTQHTIDLKKNINDVPATETWTPLAEMMFDAIGYYTQRKDFRINENFAIPSPNLPIKDACAENAILLITDGSSTADQNKTMIDKTKTIPTDNDADGVCSPLYGSTYLDDLAYYARHEVPSTLFDATATSSPYYNAPPDKNISTFIVINGEPEKSTASGECNPKNLLDYAATNGSDLKCSDGKAIIAKNPTELFNKLDILLKCFEGNASSGTAASVVSATRSGQGAVYQALFWPTVNIYNDELPSISWVGDVHGIRVNEEGVLSPDYMWSAAEWLTTIHDTEVIDQRSNYTNTTPKQRYILTSADGKGGTTISFDNDNVETLKSLLYPDISDATAATMLIDWLRGQDQNDPNFRKRQEYKPVKFEDKKMVSEPKPTEKITWRLGDIIHSSPTAVGKPIENYHMLYRDQTYSSFVETYSNRRQVIYFGANDGMLHAVNGGFFDMSTSSFSIDGGTGKSKHELGAELWAYVPYNLLPHLHCLKDTGYSGSSHKYYMDGKPRVFDVKIFGNDTDHPGGWGTILVAGMRFGGTPVDKKFISSYVIMDITNPEVAPKLLGELTYNDTYNMGYTTGIPAVAPMKSKDGTMEWYLILGSGPTKAVDNEVGTGSVSSDQPAIIAAFSLKTLLSSGNFNLSEAEKIHTLPESTKGFVSDIISVDFDLNSDYRADAIYFGTVEGTSASASGKLYRWATTADNNFVGGTDDDNIIKAPSDWKAPAVMFDPNRPISAAPSVASDGENYWLYFGTGRFFDNSDKDTVDTNYYYGIKEPMKCEKCEDDDDECEDGKFFWEKVNNVDVSGGYAANNDPPGSRHLLKVDGIKVFKNVSADKAELAGSLPTTIPSNCFFDAAEVEYFDQLVDYIVGGCCDTSTESYYAGTDGWYYQLPAGERNIGQATILGGLVTFTTYDPPSNSDICTSAGRSFLYALYYQTGTGWYQGVYDTNTPGLIKGGAGEADKVVDLGQGLAITLSLHGGQGDEKGEDRITALVGISTPAIISIKQPVLPINLKTGRTSWKAK